MSNFWPIQPGERGSSRPLKERISAAKKFDEKMSTEGLPALPLDILRTMEHRGGIDRLIRTVSR